MADDPIRIYGLTFCAGLEDAGSRGLRFFTTKRQTWGCPYCAIARILVR